MKEMDQSPFLVKPTPSSPVSNPHLILHKSEELQVKSHILV